VENIAIGIWRATGDRFAGALSGDDFGRASYDQSIFETPDCVVVPTLGSILPGWLLVVPRRPAFNFRDWRGDTHTDARGLIDEVLHGLEVSAERAIWFEHGPSAAGSLVGCGMDYAHIHVLVAPPFSFDEFVSTVRHATELSWRLSPTRNAYLSIDTESSYLIAGSQHNAVIAERVESVGSQFFRRVVAQLVGKPKQWDYKNYPHLDNVRKTITSFVRQRESIAAR
jgi:ATP adenylyltransferase